MNTHHAVTNLGQVFTPPDVVKYMIDLCRNSGRVLEPSAGDGAFYRALLARQANVTAIELDPSVAPAGVQVMDFFDFPESEAFDTVIGNPPYVRIQDVTVDTKNKLKSPMFDGRSNLFLFFIEKCVRHLKPGGELVFIVPREFIKLTAAKKLNRWLFEQGSITHFFETGDSRVFGEHTPNCAIFRFEKGRMDRSMDDGRTFTEVDGQLMFLRSDYPLPFSDIFTVKVGGVSGADEIFTHPKGNMEFVCSKTVDTGETRRMFYEVQNTWLLEHKEKLLARRVINFDESNWWRWGRHFPINNYPRIYVNGRTRKVEPFFLHECNAFDGSILALFLNHRKISRRDLVACTTLLNRNVDWQELGFICDGRFLLTQRSLQTCRLPAEFSRFLPPTAVKEPE